MEQITLREVDMTHADFLTALMNHPAIRQRLHQPETTIDDWAGAIELWLSDEDEKGYIVYCGEEPAGWFAINDLLSAEKKPYIKMAVLLPEYQDQGVGTQVIGMLVEKLRTAGYAAVGLFTDCDNLRAQRCYQKSGFRIAAKHREPWPDGSVIDRYEMTLQLKTDEKP